jgi:hypothetical protein
VSGEPDRRVDDLEARLRRVEAIIETAKRIMAGNSGIIESALIELDACDAAGRPAPPFGPCGTCWRATGAIAP